MSQGFELPKIQFRTPTDTSGENRHHSGANQTSGNSHGIYYGSYRRRAGPRSLSGASTGVSTPTASVPPSPRGSVSQSRLQDLLEHAELDQETYGLEELRDGFFDGFFFPSARTEVDELQALLLSADHDRRSLWRVLMSQVHETQDFVRKVTTTRAGVKLSKSFLGFFISYIICLVPAAGDRLGRYGYIMAISAIINHAGRTVGAQIDGFILTTIGGALGLGWGSLALYASTSTTASRAGYGGVLAAFLISFTAVLCYIRCMFVRFYQAIMCAGIAICYTCLTGTSTSVSWRKIFEFGVPWIYGQVISLIISMVVFPDAGSRSIAVALHRAFNEIEKALSLPRKDDRDVRRTLSWHITNLSDAVRDLTLDFSITRFRPSDIQTIRNLLQGVIRATLVIQPDTQLFSLARLDSSDATLAENGLRKTPSTLAVIISSRLAEPTSALLKSSMSTLATCDAVLMDLSSYRRYLGPSMDVSTDLPSALQVLSSTIEMFDSADETLLRDPRLPRAYSDHPEVVQLLLFVHPIRLVAGRILALAQKVSQMKSSKWALHRPSYPFVKALSRTNAQVRHDRGGLTAGFYFRTKRQMERTLNDLQSRTFDSVVPPHARKDEKPNADGNINESSRKGDNVLRSKTNNGRTLKHQIWEFGHYLQGFESRFTLKVVLVTTCLSIPAWLPQSNGWWNEQEVWWAVVSVWLMMHPRIGGNFQDLLTRVVAALIGAVWGGFAYAAANGNPYVVAVFAAILMIPMLYRYTQSSHPRSGIVGCISFTVVSLSAYYEKAEGNIVHFTWPRACAFMVGIVAAIVINWIIWPFVARHELRKSLSSMMQHLSVLYRSVVAKYIYYLESEAPTSRDVERSEMLEGRLREAFIRIRQLLALTKHEIRLRAPFNPKCYELLIEGCEGFFEDLVQVRQSSLYFQPRMHRVSGLEGQIMNQALLPYRRDAVASILMDMYILAGALKTTQPVPRYMPSAALARKRLLDRMAELEEAQDEETPLGLQKTLTKGRRWANVYQYAFNVALTDIVERLEDLQQSTKLIVGEKGFDLPDLPTQ